MSIKWKPITIDMPTMYVDELEKLQRIKYLVLTSDKIELPQGTIFKVKQVTPMLGTVPQVYNFDLIFDGMIGTYLKISITIEGLKELFISIEGDASEETIRTLYGK